MVGHGRLYNKLHLCFLVAFCDFVRELSADAISTVFFGRAMLTFDQDFCRNVELFSQILMVRNKMFHAKFGSLLILSQLNYNLHIASRSPRFFNTYDDCIFTGIFTTGCPTRFMRVNRPLPKFAHIGKIIVLYHGGLPIAVTSGEKETSVVVICGDSPNTTTP